MNCNLILAHINFSLYYNILFSEFAREKLLSKSVHCRIADDLIIIMSYRQNLFCNLQVKASPGLA